MREYALMDEMRAARRGMLACCVLVFCCLALSGCFGGLFGKTVLPADSGKPAAPRRMTVLEAEAALEEGQTARAEQIATRLLAQPLPQPEAGRAARVLALAASANNHPYLAMTALDRWLEAVPGADGTDEWQNAFFAALGQLPPYEALSRAQGATAPGRPFTLRAGAAVFTASKQWERPRGASSAIENLRAFYQQAGETKERAHIERAFFTSLQNTDSASLALLEPLVTEENAKAFPFAIIKFETLRRKAANESLREGAKAEAENLAEGTLLAAPSILRTWDKAETEIPPPVVVPLAGRTLVLALPLSGPLSSVGKKIADGAEEAWGEFSLAGHTVGLVTIDTDRPEWTGALAALPEKAVIVGGPLRMEALNAARAKGLTNRRVFMTFMPSLADGDEGRVAWRFFPSPEDQFAALFSAMRKLEITRYAVMMPDNDPYSDKMAELFAKHAHAEGGEVVRRLKYPAREPDKWNTAIGSFLGTSKKASNAPATPFRAVFLPDSWRNMELVVPNLFYFLETRQVLLGTSLWEQGLAGSGHIAAHYYKMALFPGAWDKNSNSQSAMRLHAAFADSGKTPDFWAALGYDFVRFAATLAIEPGWDPPSVNAVLAQGNGMPWSMAPISWSAGGKASQSLFLFTPVQGGYAPADLNEIESLSKKAWKVQ